MRYVLVKVVVVVLFVATFAAALGVVMHAVLAQISTRLRRLVIFADGSYRHGYGGNSLRRCFDLRLPLSWPRLAGT